MADYEVVSENRKPVVWIWLLVIVLGAAFVFLRDIHGGGLNQSTYFRVLGLGIYPLFYGAVAWLIYHSIGLLNVSSRYLRISGASLFIGKAAAIDRSEIDEITLGRNWMGIRELRIRRKDAPKRVLRTYFLRTSPTLVLERLHNWMRAA